MTDSTISEREMVISRVIDAPRAVVFQAFTESRHLDTWWGPEGFTTTTRSFAFVVGGSWDYVMHGPDEMVFDNWIAWRVIEVPERLEYRHGEHADDPNAMESSMTFVDHGEQTEVILRVLFPSKEARDQAAEEYHAVEGGAQTLAKLAAYVAKGFE